MNEIYIDKSHFWGVFNEDDECVAICNDEESAEEIAGLLGNGFDVRDAYVDETVTKRLSW